MGATRRELMEREVERLRDEAKVLERDWRRVPFLAGFLVLALPAQWIWGPVAAMYVVLCVPALVATAVYLVGVRRRENAELRRDLERQLARAD